MKCSDEKGFSLLELLIVVVTILIVAALAVPSLQKAARSAENGNAFSTMRTIATTQVGFYSQNSRFGRFSEMNSLLPQSVGTITFNQINHGKFVIAMVPATPTDAELRSEFEITATRNVSSESTIYKYRITQTGVLEQLLP